MFKYPAHNETVTLVDPVRGFFDFQSLFLYAVVASVISLSGYGVYTNVIAKVRVPCRRRGNRQCRSDALCGRAPPSLCGSQRLNRGRKGAAAGNAAGAGAASAGGAARKGEAGASNKPVVDMDWIPLEQRKLATTPARKR
jgi:hypothetical protein